MFASTNAHAPSAQNVLQGTHGPVTVTGVGFSSSTRSGQGSGSGVHSGSASGFSLGCGLNQSIETRGYSFSNAPPSGGLFSNTEPARGLLSNDCPATTGFSFSNSQKPAPTNSSLLFTAPSARTSPFVLPPPPAASLFATATVAATTNPQGRGLSTHECFTVNDKRFAKPAFYFGSGFDSGFQCLSTAQQSTTQSFLQSANPFSAPRHVQDQAGARCMQSSSALSDYNSQSAEKLRFGSYSTTAPNAVRVESGDRASESSMSISRPPCVSEPFGGSGSSVFCMLAGKLSPFTGGSYEVKTKFGPQTITKTTTSGTNKSGNPFAAIDPPSTTSGFHWNQPPTTTNPFAAAPTEKRVTFALESKGFATQEVPISTPFVLELNKPTAAAPSGFTFATHAVTANQSVKSTAASFSFEKPSSASATTFKFGMDEPSTAPQTFSSAQTTPGLATGLEATTSNHWTEVLSQESEAAGKVDEDKASASLALPRLTPSYSGISGSRAKAFLRRADQSSAKTFTATSQRFIVAATPSPRKWTAESSLLKKPIKRIVVGHSDSELWKRSFRLKGSLFANSANAAALAMMVTQEKARSPHEEKYKAGETDTQASDEGSDDLDSYDL